MSVTITYGPSTLEIDFGGLPIKQLHNLAELGRGNKTPPYPSWKEASEEFAAFLEPRLPEDVEAKISLGEGHVVTISVKEGYNPTWVRPAVDRVLHFANITATFNGGARGDQR